MLNQEKFKRTYNTVRIRIKDFLLSDKSREFFVFLFFFFIASGFWLLQTLNNDYETEFTVPVRLKGIPNDVVLISEPPSEVTIRVKDKGTVLLNYMLGKSFYPLVLDFQDYKGVNNHVRVVATEFQKKLQTQLNASTQLLEARPDTLDYFYSTGEAKRVPVRLNGSISAARQYYLADTLFYPDSVLVYASKEVLPSIQEVFTEPVSESSLSDTLRKQVPLNFTKGVKVVPSSVQMILPVDIFTEKTVEVPVEGVHFPSGKVLRTFPSKVQITFQVGMSRFRQITADNFHLMVSYEELMESDSEKYRLQLKHLPEGVSQVRIQPEQVDFLIEQIVMPYED